jgi:hypothetical protein
MGSRLDDFVRRSILYVIFSVTVDYLMLRCRRDEGREDDGLRLFGEC